MESRFSIIKQRNGTVKTNVKFEFIHNPADGNVTAYYTNPLTDEKHMFDFYTGKQGRQRYGIDPEFPNASEFYTVEVEPPGFYYKSSNRADPYRKDYEYYDTATGIVTGKQIGRAHV